MLGKRSNHHGQPAPPPLGGAPSARDSGAGLGSGLADAGRPPPPRPGARRDRDAAEDRKSDEYYQTKSMIFGALIEAIDLRSCPASTPIRSRGNPRHRQRDHRAEERGDVDLRAGGAA
jgi:hypothetical protein